MKNIYISVLALALLTTTGCKKFLEHAPDQRTQVNSVDKVAQLLASAYPQANYIPFAESASDNAEDKGPTVGTEPRWIVQPFYWLDNDDDNQDSPTYYWNSSYEAIAAANQALESIEKAEDKSGYLPYKGEALMARAYAHFMLVTFYSKAYNPGGDNTSPGIPYMVKPETVVSGQYSRGTVASVYEQIQKDIEEGLPLIKNDSYVVPKYHFNVAAAHAFAARFYLFKQDYAKVIEHASAISSGNAFATITRPWNTRYRTYSSAEMRVNFTQATEPSTLLLIETASSWARTSGPRYGFGQTANNTMFVAANVTGSRWSHPVYTSGGVPHYSLLKWNEYFVRTSPNATIGFPYTIVPVLTADEALLNRAEAYAQTGQNDLALRDLNTFASTRITSYNAVTHAITLAKIESFYKLGDDKAGLIKTILDFKKAEFITEGLRWFDVLRHKITVKHNVLAVDGSTTTIELGPDDPRRLFQVPSQVKLSGIEQNPR
ncbi:RagB/SusD family nutrient uptake outer membrane protein [Pedobacter sp.]|uniref:RagB/SusD family nutrient uptake outer membrane protein n=1 Tax=Pedobacter sp. TaxID=1411316 RepID=UPI003D7F263B